MKLDEDVKVLRVLLISNQLELYQVFIAISIIFLTFNFNAVFVAINIFSHFSYFLFKFSLSRVNRLSQLNFR